MDTNSKIYIAGHKGLVGSAIHKKLVEKGYSNFIFTPHNEFNLIDQNVVKEFFEKEKPEYVVLAAGKVGGITANNKYRADFIYENLQIQNNIIHQSFVNGVKKLLFLGSSCIYPKNSIQPIKEEYLLSNTLEYTNEPYAIAKIAGIKMCESYNLQYGTNFISVMPTNLYGPNDNYNLETSHVLPALIRKMHLGKCLMNNDWDSVSIDLNKRPIEGISGQSSKEEILKILNKYGIKQSTINEQQSTIITLWGSGTPRREFLHSNDLADACVFIMQKVNFKDLIFNSNEIRNTHINIGSGEDLEIKELAVLIKDIVGFKGSLEWDSNKPDGTMLKLLDINKIKNLGWEKSIDLSFGIKQLYENHYL